MNLILIIKQDLWWTVGSVILLMINRVRTQIKTINQHVLSCCSCCQPLWRGLQSRLQAEGRFFSLAPVPLTNMWECSLHQEKGIWNDVTLPVGKHLLRLRFRVSWKTEMLEGRDCLSSARRVLEKENGDKLFWEQTVSVCFTSSLDDWPGGVQQQRDTVWIWK